MPNQVLVTTPCNHQFHFRCLHNNILHLHNNTWKRCPNCRDSLLGAIIKIPIYRNVIINQMEWEPIN